MSVLLITHDQQLAQQAKRVVYINDGWLTPEGQAGVEINAVVPQGTQVLSETQTGVAP